MVETTLSKVGNSMAVLLPKALRQKAGLSAGERLWVTSPRSGVVVITAVVDEQDRAERLKAAQERIMARKNSVKPWPSGVSAEDLLGHGKEQAAHELLSL